MDTVSVVDMGIEVLKHFTNERCFARPKISLTILECLLACQVVISFLHALHVPLYVHSNSLALHTIYTSQIYMY